MNNIDQRILIPVEARIVWGYLSNLENYPEWQVDCRSVSFLTSMRAGQGTRLRCTARNGRESVIEITSWYDGLGFEYTYADGVPFRQNRGRLRLQETPDGTVVQWTFTYETGGGFGRLRNPLGSRKHLESIMADSLRTLWQVISEAGTAPPFREARSLMRDAPDAEARAQYVPRHPSVLHERAQNTSPTPSVVIPEPAVSDEDTRPRVVIAPAAAVEREPDARPVASTPDAAPTEGVPSAPESLPEFTHSSTTEVLAATLTQGAPGVSQPHDVAEDDSLIELPEPGARATPPTESTVDTGKISVFEVFGLPKPSETQQMRPVASTDDQYKPPTPAIIEPVRLAEDTQPTGATDRFMAIQRRPGLRQALRHELLRLRRP